MSICFIYDDRIPVSPEIRELLGVDYFCDILYRKKKLREHLLALVKEVGITEVQVLSADAEFEQLKTELSRSSSDRWYFYFPANLVPQNWNAAHTFLSKLTYARKNVVVPFPSEPAGPPLLFASPEWLYQVLDDIREFHWEELTRALAREFTLTAETDQLRDISRYETLIEYVSTNFDVRFFNEISHDIYTVNKISQDKKKLSREYQFLNMVEGPMRPFFLGPWDYEEQEHTASYRLERLNILDLSIQWIHGAVKHSEFSSFLDRISRYFSLRPVRPVTPENFEKVTAELYPAKIEARLKQLQQYATYPALAQYLAHGTSFGSLDRLFDRWKQLFKRLRRPQHEPKLAFTHGDLCFSNILYDRRTAQLKLIDPRGAESREEMYSHPYYDAAKLSHSVCGGYDFINHGLFEIVIDSDLSLSLDLKSPDLTEHQQLFQDRMESIGFDFRLIRLFEASLFLSMLPLHVEVPKKLIGFALTAEKIIQELESA